jgi:peptidoglycan/LPS O-acetylase OafA/YrhL
MRSPIASKSIVQIERFGDHRNTFGFIRLLLAALVIVSHTPELMDGNRSREILTRLFGTMSFGEVAVDGFFIVSGYLIFGSFCKTPLASAFLIKRIARIYPAFILASLVCVYVVAPIAGAGIRDMKSAIFPSIYNMFTLSVPVVANVFNGTPYPALDQAMWTIFHEFHCYILVLILGITGLIGRPWMILSAAVGCLMGNEILMAHGYNSDSLVRFTGIYLAGGLFFSWRDHIRFTKLGTWLASALLLGLMFSKPLAEPAFALFGGYLLLSIAFLGAGWRIAGINNRSDISYGVYLYAWPIEKLLLWYWPNVSPWFAGIATFLAACGCGWLSWHGVEKRVMRWAENAERLPAIEAALIKSLRGKFAALGQTT